MCSGRNAEEDFSILEGVNPDTVTHIETGDLVEIMVYSQSSGLIYATSSHDVFGFKWDEKNKTLQQQFEISIIDTTELSIHSITLAPRETSGGDQIYISVGYGEEMKNVYRLGGREFEKSALLPDTSYIDDECFWWILASNPDRHILLIHPTSTPFIYIHVREQKHGKVDLNQLNIPKRTWLQRIELIGQLLILGELSESKVYMCELTVTESDAFIKPGSERRPIESDHGSFAALSHVVGDEDEQVHLFAVRRDSDSDCSDISEYKFSLSVSGSEFNQLPTQTVRTLRVEEQFCPYYLVNVNSYSSVLIGGDYLFSLGKLTAVELLKAEVNHHVQLSSS